MNSLHIAGPCERIHHIQCSCKVHQDGHKDQGSEQCVVVKAYKNKQQQQKHRDV